MRIFYVAHSRIPTEKAHGAQIVKTCEAFSDLGHEIVLLVPKRRNPLSDDPFAYYGSKRNFSIVRLPTVDLVPLGRMGYWVSLVVFSKMAFWYLLFKKGDVFYGRDELPLLALSFVKRIVVWESHTGRFNIAARLLVNRIRLLVVISEGLKRFYVSKGVSQEKIIIAHDGVDLEAFAAHTTQEEARGRLGLPIGVPIAMYIGKLDREKGVYTLLEASEALEERGITVAVIGGEAGQIEDLKQKYPKVIFVGFQPYRELPVNQKAADVLVIPNSAQFAVSREFTSPLKVFAHMVSGVPMVASDTPALREVLTSESAVFSPPDDASALARAISAVLKDEAAPMRAIQAQHDAAGYSWQNRAMTILNHIAAKI